METWVKIEEFSTLANLTREKILEMVANGELKGKQEKHKQFFRLEVK